MRTPPSGRAQAAEGGGEDGRGDHPHGRRAHALVRAARVVRHQRDWQSPLRGDEPALARQVQHAGDHDGGHRRGSGPAGRPRAPGPALGRAVLDALVDRGLAETRDGSREAGVTDRGARELHACCRASPRAARLTAAGGVLRPGPPCASRVALRK